MNFELCDLASPTLKGTMTAALVASAGYLGNLIISGLRRQRKEHLRNRADLMRLQAVLRAMGASYQIQSEHRTRLNYMLKSRLGLDHNIPYEDTFADYFDKMLPEERQLHSLIRAITIHSLKPLNVQATTWLANDTYFRSRRRTARQRKLGEQLNQLDSHLWLWIAKFEMWIPGNDPHALVYLGDEHQHGIPFPAGIENTIASELHQ